MRYKPYTEAQIQSMNVMDEGIYPFQVLEVDTTDRSNRPLQDKNGNDMAKLKLLVWDHENRERIVYTFISGDGNFAYKLRHFAQTINMISEYEDGIFDIQRSMGRSGKANIVIKKGTLKQDGSGEMWPDRNDVKDFIVDGPGNTPIAVENPKLEVADNAIQDDDIPFN